MWSFSRPPIFVSLTLLLAIVDAPGVRAQDFSEVTEVLAVEVPVQVLKDGNPVSGLRAENFEIVDRRKKRQITGFEEINLAMLTADPATGEAPMLPITARRHFLFLFDLSFSRPDSVTKARTAAKNVVETKVHPTDLMAVGTYSASKGFNLVVGFTSDRAQVNYAIDTLGLANPLSPVEDPLRLVIADILGRPAEGSPPSTQNISGLGGRGPDPLSLEGRMLTALQQMQGLATQNTIDQRKNQMLALTTSMETIANLLRSVDGRVQVMFLSEGFDTSVLLGNQGFTQAERDQMAERAENIASGETWNVKGDEAYGSGAALSGMNKMLEEFRRADSVLNTVDIAGLQVGGTVDRGSSRGKERSSSLFIMADGTGGEFINNFNDLGLAMGELLERTSVTYLLAFQPDDLKYDGEFHRIKVKLKGGPKGARLIHRPGYYAPVPFGQRAPIERRMAAAGLLMGGQPGGSMPMSVLAVPVGVDRHDAYVTVLSEVEGESFVADTPGDVLPAEIYGYAIDHKGSITDFFTEVIGIDLTKYGDQLRQTGFKFWGELDLDPGDYAVRVLIRNGSTGATSVQVAEFTVPDTAGQRAMLMPPLFPEPPGKWVMARDQSRAERPSGFPFMLNGEIYFPASRPILSNSQASTACLMGVGIANRSVELTGLLLDADNQPVEGSQVSLSTPSDGMAIGQTCRPVSVSVTAPNSGDFRFEVTATDTVNGDQWSSSIPIRLEGSGTSA